MGAEIGGAKALKKSERILSLMEACQAKDVEIKRLGKLVDELLNENKAFKRAVEKWEKENEVYRKHWLDLCDKIIAENDKDGMRRLVVSRADAIEMKKIFE